MPPREAARKAMDEVTGPVVAVALVLCAVFVPCAFISGITGQFFRQFAVTIAVSTVFSAFNSLTLSPGAWPPSCLQAATALRRDPARPGCSTLVAGLVLSAVQLGLRRRHRRLRLGGRPAAARAACWSCWSTAACLSLTVLGLPQGADGLRSAAGPGPDHRATSNCPTRRRCSAPRTPWPRSRQIAPRHAGRGPHDHRLGHVLVCAGQQPELRLDVHRPRAVRRSGAAPSCSDTAIMARLRRRWAQRDQGRRRSSLFGAPPIPGLSVAGGFKLMVEDRGGLGLDCLATARPTTWSASCRTEPGPESASSTQFRSNTPQLFMDIDRTKVALPGRLAATTSTRRWRCTWARSTSPASTSSAATGR